MGRNRMFRFFGGNMELSSFGQKRKFGFRKFFDID
jgi:hypothetical protein